MIFADAAKALRQLGDPAFRTVLLRGIGLSLLLLIGFSALVLWGLGLVLPETVTLPFLGQVGWVGDMALGTAVILLLIGSVFLMIPVASAFTGLFLETVAAAVERRHYPDLPPARSQPMIEAILDSLKFLGVIVAANIAAIALYLLVPPAAAFIFYALNGFLLGREFFQMAALRRFDPGRARALRRRHGGQIWLGGALMALPLSVPVVNLVVPVLGAATFTHLVQRLAASSEADRDRRR